MSQIIQYAIITLIILITTLTILFALIKKSYGFWYYQPVVHYYDIFYMIKSPQIIQPLLPKHNKYTILDNTIIKTINVQNIDNRATNHFTYFIATHYLKNSNGNIYTPAENNLLPYLQNHIAPAFISFYYSPKFWSPATTPNKIIKDNETFIGTITSRPLIATFNPPTVAASPTPPENTLELYYGDFLCVHSAHRKQGIASHLIQTHEYNQRHMNKNIQVSLFKHEDNVLKGIVPITTYTNYGFAIYSNTDAPYNNTINTIPNEQLPTNFKTILINGINPSLVYFLETNKPEFSLFITSSIFNLNTLIKTNNIIIYVLIDSFKNNTDNIVACYCFKNSCVKLEHNTNPVLSLISSIKSPTIDDNIFFNGFMQICMEISNGRFDYLSVENVAHNNIIINNILLTISPIIKSPCAYFFYNFIYSSIVSQKLFTLF